jgi:hypothetical protein
LGRARFWNRPLNNPVQNAYERFQRKPGGEWFNKGLRDSEAEFKNKLRNTIKTHYHDMLDEF